LCAAVVVAGYAAYSSVGKGVLGFLGPYAHEEGLETGDRYFLLSWAHRYLHIPLSTAAYIAFCALMLFVVVAWAFRKQRTPQQIIGCGLAMSMMGTIFFSPHYPWYFLWILPFAVILRYVPAIVLTLAAAYWFATNLAIPGEKMFQMNKYLYGIFLISLAADLTFRWLKQRRGRAELSATTYRVWTKETATYSDSGRSL
jgi:alpha-1,6-mannosyltransferase